MQLIQNAAGRILTKTGKEIVYSKTSFCFTALVPVTFRVHCKMIVLVYKDLNV